MTIAAAFFDETIESKLLTLHTAYIGKITKISGNKATIQPLTLMKQYGQDAKQQSVIPNVPVLSHCLGKIIEKEIDGEKVLAFEKLQNGDLVVCICGERNITDALKGISSVPPIGHHSMADSIVVGVL